MTWTALTYAFGSKLTSTKMTQNQDNFTALANGDAGAPPIQNAALVAVAQAKIASSAIGQAQLKTTYGDVSVTLVAGAEGGTGLLPGGDYGFRVTVSNSASGDTYVAFLHYQNNSLTTAWGSPYLEFLNNHGTFTLNGLGRERYVQASPPYDLGDGPIPLFIFIEITPAGEIARAYVAPEAPWHNNGPTKIHADIYRDGVGYRRVRQFFEEYQNIEVAMSTGLTREQIADRLATDAMVEIEITQVFKQTDMSIIPHPFINKSIGNTVVLLNPVGVFIERLFALHETGEPVINLLNSGNIIIDNTASQLKTSPGVMPVKARWKLTK